MPAAAPSTATVTQVPSSATSVTLQAANDLRRQLIVENASTQILYLKFGTAASSTSYTVSLPAGGIYELPPIAPVVWAGEVVGGCYAGIVTGAWVSADGYAYVTEVS